jgi:beta-lactamase regulating signal transducer with metallopeptidase domain
MSGLELTALASDLGLALLHSLWQIAAVASLLWGLRILFHRASPVFHHRLAYAALVVAVVWPAGTFAHQRALRREQVLAWQVGPPSVPAAELRFSQILEGIQPALPWAGLLWVLGMTVLAARLAGGGLQLRRMGRATTEAPEEWSLLAQSLARRMGIAVPAIRLARGTFGPYSHGLIHGMVVLPAAYAAKLDPAALEAVLAHEFAHLKRFDYLFNGLQCALELLVFHHPLAWWISSVTRFERERCCDEAAVSVCGDARSFAAALLQLDAIRPPQPALAAQGAPLTLRIKHLLGASPRPSILSTFSATLLLGGLTLLASTGLKAEGSLTVVRAPASLVKLADTAASAEGLDPHLVRAMIQCESRYVPTAHSRLGAQGLLQLMPETAALMGGGDMLNPAQNLRAGTRYLHKLMDHYKGNIPLAVMAFNAGPDAVDQTEGIAPTEESRIYALAVMDLYRRKAVEPDPTL